MIIKCSTIKALKLEMSMDGTVETLRNKQTAITTKGIHTIKLML